MGFLRDSEESEEAQDNERTGAKRSWRERRQEYGLDLETAETIIDTVTRLPMPRSPFGLYRGGIREGAKGAATILDRRRKELDELFDELDLDGE